jgi:CRP-like cAMP-binding protein
MRKVEVVSKRSIREKVLSYLSLLAQNQESRYVEVPMGRLELAEYLCVDRSALTRELAKMQEEGIIDYDKNIFRVL